jgi:hypothetical protein
VNDIDFFCLCKAHGSFPNMVLSSGSNISSEAEEQYGGSYYSRSAEMLRTESQKQQEASK